MTPNLAELLSKPVQDKYIIFPNSKTDAHCNVFPIINPNDEEVVCYVKTNTPAEVEPAILRAKAAQKPWAATSGEHKADMLNKIADVIRANAERLATIEAFSGKSYKDCFQDMNDSADCFNFYANIAKEIPKHLREETEFPMAGYKSYTEHKPVGVIACIIPWNYPLLMAVWKLAPILACGSTCVIKPAELTPLSLIEVLHLCESFLPADIITMILGTGAVLGQSICESKNINKVMFTGSIPTALKIKSNTINNLVDGNFELGGKSPSIVFADRHGSKAGGLANINIISEWVLFGVFGGNGQVCSATSRVIIEDKIFDLFTSKLVEHASQIPVGNSFNQIQGQIGPLVCKSQYDRVMNYINGCIKEGGKVLYGGKSVPINGKGYFVQPTILLVEEHMKAWQEEIFGPVLTVMKSSSVDQSISLANNTIYGLGAAIFSDDQSIVNRCHEEVKCGLLWINCSQLLWYANPWKGIKASGCGTGELGGISSCLRVYYHTVSVIDNVDVTRALDYYPNILK